MIFILGIERSATTWLSNLFEAHPKTMVYVEPLSRLTGQFENWPDRFSKISDKENMAEYFLDEFENIRNHKTWLLTKFFSVPLAWKFDLWFSNFLVRKNLAVTAARDFSEINFHRKNQLYVKKSDFIEHEIVKELRLNFNADIIKYIDGDARVLVIVRNVFANIDSIIQNMKKGNLQELKESLLRHYGEINLEVVYKYWRDSYNSLLNTLDKSEMAYMVVNHTDLLKNPKEEVKQLADFAGLEDYSSLVEFVSSSNTKGEGIHNTNRNHRALLKRNREAERNILPHIQELIEKDSLHPKLRDAFK